MAGRDLANSARGHAGVPRPEARRGVPLRGVCVPAQIRVVCRLSAGAGLVVFCFFIYFCMMLLMMSSTTMRLDLIVDKHG